MDAVHYEVRSAGEAFFYDRSRARKPAREVVVQELGHQLLHIGWHLGAERLDDARSDLYALCCLQYELPMGALPFTGPAGMCSPSI